MKSKVITDIAEKIRLLREEYSLTQAEIAALTGLSEATISRYANSDIDPKAGTFALVLFLGLHALYKELSEDTQKKLQKEIKGMSGKQLKLMRVNMELSQLELAARLGVSGAAISRWEKSVVKIEHLPIITLAMIQVAHDLEQEQKEKAETVSLSGKLEPVAA